MLGAFGTTLERHSIEGCGDNAAMGAKYDLERDTSHHPIEPKVLLKGNFPEQDGDASNRKEAGTQSRFTEMGYPDSPRSWVNSFLEISLRQNSGFLKPAIALLLLETGVFASFLSQLPGLKAKLRFLEARDRSCKLESREKGKTLQYLQSHSIKSEESFRGKS
jgi:hypothetical protein